MARRHWPCPVVRAHGMQAKPGVLEVERDVVQRHASWGWYSPLPALLSSMAGHVIADIIAAGGYTIVAYWMIGFAPTAKATFMFWWALTALCIYTTGLARVMTTLAGKGAGIGIVGFSLLVGITAGGTFLTKMRLPVYFRCVCVRRDGGCC